MKRIVLYPRSLVEEISSGFLRMKNLDSICLDAVLIHYITRSMSIHSRQKRKQWGCNPTSDCQKWHHDMPQHSASILWSPPHTPGLVTLSANLVVLQSDVRHGLVDLQRLGQCLEAATYQGRRLARGLYGQNKMTFHWDMSISLIPDLANNPEINSCLQPLHIWQLSSIRDERWNYSTSKETKLLSVKDCQWHDINTCRGFQRRQPHTRPWHPRRQCHSLRSRCSWRTYWSAVPRPRPGGSDRSRLASRF